MQLFLQSPVLDFVVFDSFKLYVWVWIWPVDRHGKLRAMPPHYLVTPPGQNAPCQSLFMLLWPTATIPYRAASPSLASWTQHCQPLSGPFLSANRVAVELCRATGGGVARVGSGPWPYYMFSALMTLSKWTPPETGRWGSHCPLTLATSTGGRGVMLAQPWMESQLGSGSSVQQWAQCPACCPGLFFLSFLSFPPPQSCCDDEQELGAVDWLLALVTSPASVTAGLGPPACCPAVHQQTPLFLGLWQVSVSLAKWGRGVQPQMGRLAGWFPVYPSAPPPKKIAPWGKKIWLHLCCGSSFL